ncbi:hypothetical protein GUITHDRAFT_146867 [Guillardia theta CCMP2712]|uniref:Uncharacterized protein n=1 Tax=Guillardia theta (strain CCMP2712) TaxID=905079 RepID=L1IFC6_GUITC|nr:hypothetical protein GUITHDRAFT_146867 [Guillardia theta CCMP2712]EKX34961.1 hypothetical protein GUITHDRAFT_146867 [Guillardia theta CCMP2712]|eukprot:XP_005821941.1 hypothetical protein GUITHDRAFT_146867 [Guillardia theta CCMP2712]
MLLACALLVSTSSNEQLLQWFPVMSNMPMYRADGTSALASIPGQVSEVKRMENKDRKLAETQARLKSLEKEVEKERNEVQRAISSAKEASSTSTSAASARVSEAEAREATGLPWHPLMGTDISFVPTSDYPEVMKGSWHNNELSEEQEAAGRSSSGLEGMRGLPWQEGMGTDISFIPTSDFPGVMRYSWHHNEDPREEEERAAPKTQSMRLVKAKSRSGKGESQERIRFDEALNRFLSDGSRDHSTVVRGHQKSLKDYNFDSQAKDGEETWTAGLQYKGGPCSFPGACNHGKFVYQGDDSYMAGRHNRYAKDEEKEDESGEVKSTGTGEEEGLEDAQLMNSLDDYVSSDDAEMHDLLTSSAPRVDHFGHLAPNSIANQKIMYGPWYHQVEANMVGHPIHPEGKGRRITAEEVKEAQEKAGTEFYQDYYPTKELGDDQIGGEDEEVPVPKAKQEEASMVEDHLGALEPESEENQRIVNGKYWKELRRDGLRDRVVGQEEGERQLVGATRDRTLADHVTDFHFYSFPRDDKKIFTGTDEDVENKIGTLGSNSKYM